MEQSNDKLVKYTHPAAMGYDLTKLYTLDELKKELDMEMIKVLFTPIGWKFEDLEVKRKFIKVEDKKED